MRLFLILMLFSFVCLVRSKTGNVKSLTESMGQEVIEVGPIKDLPPGLDEEPSAEVEDNKLVPETTKTTKKDTRRTAFTTETKKRSKDIDKIDGVSQDDEEARIAKELADIYKDTVDYKDNDETVKSEKPSEVTTPKKKADSIPETDLRRGNQLQLEPNPTDKASVERFRTSIDDISCESHQSLADTTETNQVNSSSRSYQLGIIFGTVLAISSLYI